MATAKAAACCTTPATTSMMLACQLARVTGSNWSKVFLVETPDCRASICTNIVCGPKRNNKNEQDDCGCFTGLPDGIEPGRCGRLVWQSPETGRRPDVPAAGIQKPGRHADWLRSRYRRSAVRRA